MSFEFHDIENTSLKYSFKERIYTDVWRHYGKTPLFAYDLIDTNVTDYHFSQGCFDNVDIVSYFKLVKSIYKRTIDELIDFSPHGEHIHFYTNPNKNLKNLWATIMGLRGIRDEQMPVIGQMGLYTVGNADRQQNIKCPRIYFAVGPHAVLYILFYDPYHEINPGK